ncbi:MAG: YigZ family protein [Rhodanobacteraceae bacterium]
MASMSNSVNNRYPQQQAETLAGEADWQQEIRKSRFLARAAPVASADAAAAFVAHARVADASHNCWAWRVGRQYRSSDDGEPGGSAGRPILQAIDGQSVDHVAVVVTRWFGGVKLGTGGLARAYGGTAAHCLRLAPRLALIERVEAELRCDFTALPLVHSRLAAFAAEKSGERFDTVGAVLRLILPRANLDALDQFVRDATRGQGSVRVMPDAQ